MAGGDGRSRRVSFNDFIEDGRGSYVISSLSGLNGKEKCISVLKVGRRRLEMGKRPS